MGITFLWCLVILLVVGCLLSLRVIYVIRKIRSFRTMKSSRIREQSSTATMKTMIIAGSGGHSTEILRLLSGIDTTRYKPRVYVVANTDRMSDGKITNFEKNGEHFEIVRIPRSREVKQSWSTTVWSTLVACLYCLPLTFYKSPDLILCNGPGTCIPLCLAGFLLTVLGVKKVAIVFVESICRVETLSLSGKILHYFADELIVQWPQLQLRYPQTRYIGKIV
ncbi:UDP-N-acetylglucosamine transferase subunit ALG14-like [Tubulanus polymorphus]|uniref:UDP-N-acetylglucosamine transferase subunit ALG14-like n=1 Tax=Tubulanus polymorphus TaxID=672921 RepID=UPI003DA2C9BB